MVVVVIVATLLVSASGAWTDGGGQALDLVERQVRDAVQFARAEAMATRAPVGVVFDPATDRFAVVADGGGMVVDPLTKQDYLVDFDRPNQPSGVSIEAAVFGSLLTAVVFDAQGVPVAGGSVTLAHNGLIRTLVVDGATGLVTSS
jgi:Tfp pilus assembly protein FimT